MNKPDIEKILAEASEIAVAAGAVLMRHFRNIGGYEKKGKIDLLTIADKDAEALVIGEITRRFPDHAILAEEGGRLGNADSEFLWIVDPLDGTTNFAHGIRIFAVSIGLTWRGEPIVGVVNAPALEELYTCGRGLGAYRNGERIHVSQARTLEDALIVTGFPYDRDAKAATLMNMFRSVMVSSQGIVRFGAAAWDFACVASGHLEGFYEWGLRPWDMAAGALLVQEAGGTVTGMVEGEPFDLFTPRTVASNGLIHGELLAALKRGGVEDVPIRG